MIPMAKHAELKGQIASTHFTWEEARCRCCGMLPANKQIIINTANWMEKIRAYLGNQPIYVNSWFRCPSHNNDVGGARDSQHLQGTAVDFRHSKIAPARVQAILKPKLSDRILSEGHLFTIGGLGQYSSFTHVDRRNNGPAFWKG